MDAPIRSRRPGEGRGRRLCARRPALGVKLTVVLLFIAVLLLAFLGALLRGLA